MVNRTQFKVSFILGAIIFIIQVGIGFIPGTGMYRQLHPVFALFNSEIWYVPVIYIILKIFVISAIIYLILRVINYILNYIIYK